MVRISGILEEFTEQMGTLTAVSETHTPDMEAADKFATKLTVMKRYADDLAAPPYYAQPRWYYNPATHFLADLWPVYLLEMGMGRKTMLALALPIIALGMLCLGAGWFGLARRGRWSRTRGRASIPNQAESVGV